MAKATPVGARIVQRIAAREGVDPFDLDGQLYDVIDADALDALTNGTDNRHPRKTLHVEFSYHGYAVTVDGSGQVSIDEQPTPAESDESARKRVGDD